MSEELGIIQQLIDLSPVRSNFITVSVINLATFYKPYQFWVVLAELLKQLWQTVDAVGQIFLFENGEILKK